MMNTQELLSKVMLYFRPGVLAVFHSQSEKYEVWTDEFSGEVRIRDGYSEESEDAESETRLSVPFGFRIAHNGERSIAVWAPRLGNASDDERRVWTGFSLSEDEMSTVSDFRFNRWVERYVHGNWDVPDGPIARMDTVVREINAVSQCVVGAPLFRSGNLRQLCFPDADNNHRYYAAHAKVFKRLIDKQRGLNKDAIKLLAERFGIALKLDNDKTLDALSKILSEDLQSKVREPLDTVLVRRRLDGHEEMPPEAFPAFDTFARDMDAVVLALETLRDYLARRLDVDVATCARREQAMRHLPTFDPDRPLEPNHAVAKVLRVEGKQVQRVQAGYQMRRTGRHDSEAIIFEFSDGSLLSIDALTNIGQLIREGTAPIQPEKLHVTFDVTYVPPPAPFTFELSSGQDGNGKDD